MYKEYYRYDSEGFYRQCTTKQAAEYLGVTRHEIARLVHAGILNACRSAGDAFLIDVVSLHDYAQLNKGKGRPFSTSVAWGALWHLSKLDVDWLTYQQSRRLKMRLDEIDADTLLWAVRNRARMSRFSLDESLLSHAKKELVLTGGSTSNLSSFGLTNNPGGLEGYIMEDDVLDFLARFRASSNEKPNFLLRVIDDNTPTQVAATKKMPVAVVAADLASSLVSRERSAGRDKIEELLDERRRAA